MVTNAFIRIRELLLRHRGEQAGQGMVEYALILLSVAIVLIVIVAVIGSQTKNNYSNISNSYPQ